MILPVQKQKLFLVSVSSQAATELQGIVMSCVDSETHRTVKLSIHSVKKKQQSLLHSEIKNVKRTGSVRSRRV